jgi:hypothetical protein
MISQTKSQNNGFPGGTDKKQATGADFPAPVACASLIQF